MTLYCLVSNGVVLETPRDLPRDYAGVINFHLVENPEDYGWLPVTFGTVPSFDPETEYLATEYVVGEDAVEASYVKVGYTQEQIDLLNPVPTSVSSAQACVVLDEDGILDAVEALVAASPRVVQIWYQRANEWERSNPYMLALADAMGLTDAQIDSMFRRAAKK